MGVARHNAVRWWMLGASAFVGMAAPMLGRTWVAQAAASAGQTAPANVVATGSGVVAEKPQPVPGIVLDRVIAVVNGDVILESDVDQERRFEEIQPYRTMAVFTREKAIERLIDRALILQQAALEPEDAVSDKDLDDQLLTLRKDIPACKQYHCETDAGWRNYVEAHGFTVEEFRERWRKRMELLKFIEVRFRNGITVSDDQIKNYFEKTMLPEYAKRNVTPPKLETISNRIEEVLLQQEVGDLLEVWLKSLRAQGSVRIMTAGEAAP